jgi:hypothetical protein
MPSLIELLATSLVSTALLAGLGYFMRATIGEWLTGRVRQSYAKALEDHKASLKIEGDITLERLKAALQADAAISHVRYSTQYEKAAEVLVGIHGKLDDAFEAVAAYTSIIETNSMGTKAERREKVNDAIVELRNYYRKNRIYLPSVLAERIKELTKSLFDAANHFSIRVEHRDPHEDQTFDAWNRTYNKMKDDVKPMLETMERHFRAMLGIDQMFAKAGDGEPSVRADSR